MKSPSSDRNLLFGMLALQMEFVSQRQLVDAMHIWVLNKHKTLGQILIEQGNLTSERLTLLEALVQEHLRMHDNDTEKSLAAMDSGRTLRTELEKIADDEIQTSLRK